MDVEHEAVAVALGKLALTEHRIVARRHMILASELFGHRATDLQSGTRQQTDRDIGFIRRDEAHRMPAQDGGHQKVTLLRLSGLMAPKAVIAHNKELPLSKVAYCGLGEHTIED